MTKFNLRRFIKIALLITLLLALVEVAVIFVLSDKKNKIFLRKINDKAKRAATPSTKNNSIELTTTRGASKMDTLVKDSVAMKHPSDNRRSTYFQAPPPASHIASDTILAQPSTIAAPVNTKHTTSTSVKAVTHYLPAIDSVSTKKFSFKSRQAATTAIEKKSGKNLSRDEMAGILNDINAERKRMKISSKCVQLQKASNSNIDNAFAVAEFLRSNGFIISGRMTIPKTQDGTAITTSGDCMTLIIGNL